MIRPKQIPRAVATVTIFWTTLLIILQFDLFDWQRFIGRELLLVMAAGIGVMISAVTIYAIRQGKLYDLTGKPVRGMECSISTIPIHRQTLPMAASNPDLSKFMPPEVVSAKETGFIDQWRARWGKTHPAHVRLMDALLRTFTAPGTVDLPATHATDPRHNHGGRSLMTHSLMVSWLMWREANRWDYVPAYASGKRLPLRNPDYRFNPKDPMVALLGLAHDIGKIECFILEQGKVVECKKNHDLIGAQILARMDEYWDAGISVEDREILQLVVAHYHHPSEIPFGQDGLVISDRLHALLEFLIKCDRLASAIENGSQYDEAIANAEELALFDENEEGRQDLWSGIIEVLGKASRINSDMPSTNVGWFYRMPNYANKGLLVLKEDSFMIQVAHVTGQMDLWERKTGGANGVSELTRQALSLLGKRNALFVDHEDTPRAPESSLFSVDFYEEKTYFMKDKSPKNGLKTRNEDGQVIVMGEDRPLNPQFEFSTSKYDKDSNPTGFRTHFASCILINVDEDEEIRYALGDAIHHNWKSVPHLLSARTGSQGVKTSQSMRQQKHLERQAAGQDGGRLTLATMIADKEAQGSAPATNQREQKRNERYLDPNIFYDHIRLLVLGDKQLAVSNDQVVWVIRDGATALREAKLGNRDMAFFNAQDDEWKNTAGLLMIREEGSSFMLGFKLRDKDIPQPADDIRDTTTISATSPENTPQNGVKTSGRNEDEEAYTPTDTEL